MVLVWRNTAGKPSLTLPLPFRHYFLADPPKSQWRGRERSFYLLFTPHPLQERFFVFGRFRAFRESATTTRAGAAVQKIERAERNPDHFFGGIEDCRDPHQDTDRASVASLMETLIGRDAFAFADAFEYLPEFFRLLAMRE